MVSDIEEIKDRVFDTIASSRRRVTHRQVEDSVRSSLNAEREQVKTAVNALVSEGRLEYTYMFGSSFLEESITRPMRVSDHVVIKPPETSFSQRPGDMVVNMSHGASFGNGRHPTTRLCIRGMEYVRNCSDNFCHGEKTCALDVGTGSGVLAILAVRMGMATALGLDMDSCARKEAADNVKLNGLEDRIRIEDISLERISRAFSLVVANLRYPTIIKMCSHVQKITLAGGVVVISGIKTREAETVLETYADGRFTCVWQEAEKGWSGLVLMKTLSGLL